MVDASKVCEVANSKTNRQQNFGSSWEMPYKWRCSWENHLYLGDFPLPCLITKLKPRFRFCASRHREEGPRKGAVVHKPKGRPIPGLSPENLGRWIGTQFITIWL